MLMFCDAAMISWVQAAFTNVPVYHVYPEQARARIAYLSQSPNTNPDANTPKAMGLPAIACARTDSPIGDHLSLAQASTGFNMGPLTAGPNARKYNSAELIPVRAEYTVSAYTKQRSDMVEIERAFAFLSIYNALQFQVKCIDPNNPTGPAILSKVMKFPVASGPSISKRQVNDKTGKVLVYELEKKFIVDTYWMKSHLDPYIGEIDVHFKELMNNQEDPITAADLEFIEIHPRSS